MASAVRHSVEMVAVEHPGSRSLSIYGFPSAIHAAGVPLPSRRATAVQSDSNLSLGVRRYII